MRWNQSRGRQDAIRPPVNRPERNGLKTFEKCWEPPEKMISPWLYILTRQLDIKINVPNRNRVPTNRSHLLQNWDKQTNKKQLKNRNKNKNNSAKSIPQTFQTAVVAAVTFGDNLKKTAIKISIRLNLWRREECHAQVISHPVFTVDDRVALFLRRSQWEMKRQQRYPTAGCWVERWRRI